MKILKRNTTLKIDGKVNDSQNIKSKNLKPEKDSLTLRKVLGLFDGVAILIGITIGAGIYSTPQIIAGYCESFFDIIILWLLVGAFVFIGSLIFAELGTRLPNTGGEYIYLSRTFGPSVGFIFGCAQLFIIRTSSVAGLAIITANYFGFLVPLSALGRTLIALLAIGVLGILNYTGIQNASYFQKISTIVKVAGLFFLIAIGFIFFDHNNQTIHDSLPVTSNLGMVGNTVAAIMLIIFNYTGWDRVGYPAGEMKKPRKIIPLSMIVGMSIILVLYISTNYIYYKTLGLEGFRNSDIVASDVAIKLIGPNGAAFIAVLVVISAMGSMNGTIMTAPRVYYAMAKDGLFSNWFGYIHPTYKTPSNAILAHCVWAAVILLVRGQFETIASGMVFAILIFYVLTTASLFKLRNRENDTNAFKVPLYPLLPAIYIAGILCLVILRVIYEWEKSLVDLAFITIGVPFLFFWRRKKIS